MELISFSVLIPLVSGFLFVSTFDPLRYKTARTDNNRLYFYSAFYGIIIFLVSFVIGILLFDLNQINTRISIFIYKYFDFIIPIEHGTIIVTLIITLLLGPIFSFLLNKILPGRIKNWFYEDAIKNNDFDKLFLRAIEQEMPLSITLNCGKVYIGRLIRTPDPAKERTEIRILPILSGYRTKTTQKLKFTTEYSSIYEKIIFSNKEDEKGNLNHLAIEDFEMVIPFKKVKNCNLFDLNAYFHFTGENSNSQSIIL